MIPPVSCSIFLKLKRVLWTLAFILCLGPACRWPCAYAQGFDATDLCQPTDLAAIWLVHAGDDPAYAHPDFDDSKWMKFDSTKDLHDLFPHNHPEIVWYRLHVKVSPNQTGLALLENSISPAFEVYSNSVKLLQVGKVAPFVPYDYYDNNTAELLLPIPESQIATGSVVIALRVHIAASEWANPGPGYDSENLTIGQENALREHVWVLIIGKNALPWLSDLVQLAMGIGALLLFLTQREREEYLWLFLLVLCEIPNMLIGLFVLTHACPLSWVGVCQIVSVPYVYFHMRMYCAFVGHRVGWKLQVYTAAATLANGYLIVKNLTEANNGFLGLIGYTTVVVLMVVIVPVVMMRQIRRGKYLEGILLIPLSFADFESLLVWSYLAGSQIPAFRNQATRFFVYIAGFQAGPFSLTIGGVSTVLELLSLALIILIRSNRISRQQSLLEAEMANAREVQQVILPEAVETVPGFRIESIYHPAQQVGGDFFQIIPHKTDGSLLIVAGDVTGKGLKAGMLVALLVGAIRSTERLNSDPEVMLHELNEQLMGRRDAQATCLALRIDKDGAVTLANAGHIAPYLNGEPLPMEGALPLGMIEDPDFSVMRFRLSTSDKLILMSDGIPEATDADGHLFGFERVHELLSTATNATDIAAAAQSFGQEDDISVITIQRVAIGEESTELRAAPVLAPA